ncbi:putative bcs1 aaa-type ATPase [Trypanosoma grayi]|uniref:putative bcs1 aaa-type ATPase n=1 Tax=Trypanosoma grayi TaxID=71804 RepID=UPI0004F42EE0|nr:putative bcs1 aaa-type ATPase [Trypanosoma grayi]KEG15664.1 putative bcs1 aaa-type ATPase [Trypanosoma grayi]
MSLFSWMDSQRFAVELDETTPFPLTSATTAFNMFQAVVGNSGSEGITTSRMFNGIVDITVALFLAAAARHFYRFMKETWPAWVARWVRRFLDRSNTKDGAAVDVFRHQPEEFAFDNELLVTALERYVSHLLHTDVGLLQQQQQQQQSKYSESTNRANDNDALQLSSRQLRMADYRFVPVCAPDGTNRGDLAGTLRRHYRLLLLPAEGHVLEVEPGLTVCFQQQRVPTATLKAGKVFPRRAEQGDLNRFPPLNFDIHPTRRDLVDTRSTKSDGDSRDADEEEGEEPLTDGTVSETGMARCAKNTIVRQAVLQCTDNPRDGKERIMDFASRAYAWYYPTVTTPVERYYFYPANTEMQQAVAWEVYEPSDVSQRLHMLRFPIPDGRNSFHSLFFRQKSQLLCILEDFQQKRGRFAVPGVPHQLVILLHGAPGTGKTTALRSIAKFLNRHIVAIPIEFIQTNGTLQEVLSGGTALLHGGAQFEGCDDDCLDEPWGSCEMPLSCDLPVDQVVYALEDFDLLADMLSLQLPSEQHRGTSPRVPLMESHEGKDVAVSLATTAAASAGVHVGGDYNACNEEQEQRQQGEGEEGEGKVVAETCSADGDLSVVRSYQKRVESDSLSAEGVLRALEADYAPPGRVVVLTTNHPQRLPAALWQPGVLTFVVHMSNMDAATAMEFVAHYCHDSLTPELRARFEALFARGETEAGVISPASLEHMLQACGDAEALLEELEKRF